MNPGRQAALLAPERTDTRIPAISCQFGALHGTMVGSSTFSLVYNGTVTVSGTLKDSANPYCKYVFSLPNALYAVKILAVLPNLKQPRILVVLFDDLFRS